MARGAGLLSDPTPPDDPTSPEAAGRPGPDAVAQARAVLARVQDPGRTAGDRDIDLADVDALLAGGADALPPALAANLRVMRGAVLAQMGRTDEALEALRETADRHGADPELVVAQIVAFALVTRVNVLVATGDVAQAVADADELRARFAARPDDEALPGFGTMLLDVAFWLLGQQRDEEVLAIADELVARLSHGTGAGLAVAAGARFFAAQAAGRLGRMDDSRAAIEALCAMGDPALAALDRITAQFGDTAQNPSWHAQIAATTATVLWRTGRVAEASELARRAAQTFAGLGETELATMLAQLAEEIEPA